MRAGRRGRAAGQDDSARGFVRARGAQLSARADCRSRAAGDISRCSAHLGPSTADETAHLLLPPGIDKLSPLAETLRAYADCDLNVARAVRTAQRARQHRPLPAAARAGADGRDPRRFSELVEPTTALRIIAM